MKKYLLIVLAAICFAACENESAKNESGFEQKGELESSYVAITLAADDFTRADDGKYDAGLDVERTVKSAYVFFFKDVVENGVLKEGAAFPVSYTEPTTTNSGSCNYLPLTLETNTDNPSGMLNVSDIKKAVLVLRNYKGEYPDKMVVVINWDPTSKTSYTFSELKTKVLELGSDENGYIMSNAVYADDTKQVINAVPLTIDDIYKNETDAIKNPITIYVERIAAKVVFSAKNNGKFPVGKEINGEPVYAQIQSFELYNDYQKSRLIKQIDPNWTVAELGFNWNDAPWYRSYWAISIGTQFEDNTFAWNSDNNTPLDEFVYCGENTRAWTEAQDYRTKVIVKAKLVKNDANNTPIEVVNWFGKDYIGEGNLKVVVANTLSNTYFYSADGLTFTSISDADIKCVERGPENRNAYEVYFQLSPAGEAKTWYKYENGAYTEDTNFNATLATIEPALIYKGGMTYYWTDIKHLGNQETSIARYGVVRNHVYKVNISEIKGYGTPVYNGDTKFNILEKPQDISTFVAAEIKVLSWRLVEHNYPLN